MAAKTKALRLLLALPLPLFHCLSPASLSRLCALTLSSASAASLRCAAESRQQTASLSLFLLLSTACSLYLLLAVHLSRSTSRPLLFHSFSLLLHLSSFVLFPSFSLGLLPFRAVACTTMRMLNISKCCACS